MPEDSEPKRVRSGTLAVLGFTLAYLALAAAGALESVNREFGFYIAVMLVLVAAVLVVHTRVNLSTGVLWALSLWGLAHMAGGLCPVPESWPTDGPNRVLYSWWLVPHCVKYDNLIHAYGFAVTTCVCWEGLRAILASQAPSRASPQRPTLGMLILCGAAALGFGALNEVVEFAATLLVPNTNVGGYMNTGWDLVSNLVGVLVAVVWIRLSHWR